MIHMKKSAKMNMVASMAKVEALPAQTADELIYDLAPSPAIASPAATPTLPKSAPKTKSTPAAAAPAPTPEPVAPAAPTVKIPFTNQLTPETFLRLKQFECWGGMEIQDILEEALTQFFSDKPEADRELPAKAKERLRKKLPNIK